MKSLIFSESSKTPVTLKQIPRSQYMDAPICKDPLNEKSRKSFFQLLRKKQAPKKPTTSSNSRETFSVAAWLSFDVEVQGAYSLLITYEDSWGEQDAVIEKTVARGTKSIMLSGQATIEVKGDLESLKVQLLGLPPETRCWVDDVHFQKKARPVEESQTA
ncbi:hypothetical protein ACFOEK_03850 [Litoribrevibacter euphylliae]|uniref:Uncharacterized protein n=1 Tax=Litoribrevibacter euphylliae TaxID=1834034 RepID=A0ABV7HBR5_9GAMM